MNKTPDDDRCCPTCGTVIPKVAAAGFCPVCLLQAESPDSTERSRPDQSSFSIEELQAHFPDLEIMERLGAGGMGTVYQVRQKRLDRFAALKVLTCRPEFHDSFSLRFEREAQVLARLSHPHIVSIYDFGEVELEDEEGHSLFWFLMEFVDGADLSRLIRAKTLTPEQALPMVPQICDALQYAHDTGVAHRDIKPANILVTHDGQVKIADFGLAAIRGKDGGALASGITMTGTAMGTPHYMAPEHWDAPDQVDHRADLYSLGVVIYEMLTGGRPSGLFDPPSRKVKVDVRLDEVVLKALEKEPERRYQSASEIGQDVERVAERTARNSGKGVRSKAWWMIGVGVVAAVLVGFVLLPDSAEEEAKEPDSRTPLSLTVKTNLPDPSTLPKGRVQTAGKFMNGAPLRLSRLEGMEDIVDIRCNPTSWFALRSGGHVVASEGVDFPGPASMFVDDISQNRCTVLTSSGMLGFAGNDIPEELPEDLLEEMLVDAATGQNHSLALTSDGRVLAWGDIYEGPVGNSVDQRSGWSPRWEAPPENFLEGMVDVAVTQTHAATLDREGRLRIWNWDGLVTLEAPEGVDRFTTVRSGYDMLTMEDPEGDIWRVLLARNPSHAQPMKDTRYLKRIGTGTLENSTRFWRTPGMKWESLDKGAGPLPPRFVKVNRPELLAVDGFQQVRPGENGEPRFYLMWLEPTVEKSPESWIPIELDPAIQDFQPRPSEHWRWEDDALAFAEGTKVQVIFLELPESEIELTGEFRTSAFGNGGLFVDRVAELALCGSAQRKAMGVSTGGFIGQGENWPQLFPPKVNLGRDDEWISFRLRITKEKVESWIDDTWQAEIPVIRSGTGVRLGFQGMDTGGEVAYRKLHYRPL